MKIHFAIAAASIAATCTAGLFDAVKNVAGGVVDSVSKPMVICDDGGLGGCRGSVNAYKEGNYCETHLSMRKQRDAAFEQKKAKMAQDEARRNELERQEQAQAAAHGNLVSSDKSIIEYLNKRFNLGLSTKEDRRSTGGNARRSISCLAEYPGRRYEESFLHDEKERDRYRDKNKGKTFTAKSVDAGPVPPSLLKAAKAIKGGDLKIWSADNSKVPWSIALFIAVAANDAECVDNLLASRSEGWKFVPSPLYGACPGGDSSSIKTVRHVFDKALELGMRIEVDSALLWAAQAEDGEFFDRMLAAYLKDYPCFPVWLSDAVSKSAFLKEKIRAGILNGVRFGDNAPVMFLKEFADDKNAVEKLIGGPDFKAYEILSGNVASGKYYLIGDVKLTGKIRVPKNADVVINLMGCEMGEAEILVSKEGKLKLTNGKVAKLVTNKGTVETSRVKFRHGIVNEGEMRMSECLMTKGLFSGIPAVSVDINTFGMLDKKDHDTRIINAGSLVLRDCVLPKVENAGKVCEIGHCIVGEVVNRGDASCCCSGAFGHINNRDGASLALLPGTVIHHGDMTIVEDAFKTLGDGVEGCDTRAYVSPEKQIDAAMIERTIERIGDMKEGIPGFIYNQGKVSFGGNVRLHMPSLIWFVDDPAVSFFGSVKGGDGALQPYEGNQINVKIDYVNTRAKPNPATLKGKVAVHDTPAGKFTMKDPPSGLFPEEQPSEANGLVNLVLVEE